MLYVGEPTGMSPYPMLESDPLIWPYPVQASTVVFSFETAKRSMRQYMPRTFKDLSAYQVFQGALPLSQSSFNCCASLKVSIERQNDECR